MRGKRLQGLVSDYRKNETAIQRRLAEFDTLKRAQDEEIFAELAFCIFTPGSKALNCDKAVKDLKESRLLLNGAKGSIARAIRGLVRFHNNKAYYLIAARNFFNHAGDRAIKGKLNGKDIFETREWLVKNIKGLGHKEASHFLRNIGLGSNIAILDRHILKNLKKYRVIDEIPASMNKAAYLAIEDEMREFSKRIGIPLSELDLLFWRLQTGYIFK